MKEVKEVNTPASCSGSQGEKCRTANYVAKKKIRRSRPMKVVLRSTGNLPRRQKTRSWPAHGKTHGPVLQR